MRHLAVTVALAFVVVASTVSLAAPTKVTPAALPFTAVWSRDYQTAPPVAAAVSDGGWLVAGFADHLEIISMAAGESLGQLPLPAPRLACDATICIASDDTTIRAVDLARRTVRWQKPAPGPLAFAPTLRSGWVFVTTSDGHISAWRDSDGADVWSFAAPAKLTGPPSVDGDRIAIATASAAVILLDIRTGRALWTTQLYDALRRISGAPGAPRLGGGVVYVGTENSDLVFLSAKDGHPLAAQRTGATIVGAPALDDRFIYTVGQDGVLRAFDRGDGALKWYSDLPTRPAGIGPVADTGIVIAALRSGHFQVFLPDGDGKKPAAALSAGVGDSTVLLPVPPMIAGSGASMKLVTISVSVGDSSKWTAFVLSAGARLPLSALPKALPGLALTLTEPR